MKTDPITTYKLTSNNSRFGYGGCGDEQWAKVEMALQHLEPNKSDLEQARISIHVAIRILMSSVGRPTVRQRRKAAEAEWARISDLTHELQLLWHAQTMDKPPAPAGCEPNALYKLIDDGLLSLSALAARQCKLKADDNYPDATPKTVFFYRVLEVWTWLGGELKFSRHPTTHKIKGPLARYFEAATKCVCGGSLESLPDIIRRHKQYSAEREKWRATRSAMEASRKANGEEAA